MNYHIPMTLALVVFFQTIAGAQLNFPIASSITPGGADKQIQFNNGGSLGGLVSVQGDLNHLAFLPQAASYSGSGTAVFKMQGFPVLTVDNAILSAIPLQTTGSAAFREEILATNSGIVAFATTASVIGSGAFGTISGTDALSMDRRYEYTGNTAANSLAAMSSSTTLLTLGTSSNGRGFLCTFLCASTGNPTNQHFLAYLSPSAVTTSTTLLTSGTNIIGVGFELGDTNYSIFHNDGSGAVSKVGLGANFPTSTASQAYLHTTFYSPTGSSSVVHYRVKNLMNGAVSTGTINSDLPPSNIFLGWRSLANNLSSGVAPKMLFGGYYSESY
jgi:hypothetical protein